jgi:hypothetical protein
MKKILITLGALLAAALALVAVPSPAHAAIASAALNCTYEAQHHPNITGYLQVEAILVAPGDYDYKVTIDLNDKNLDGSPGDHHWGWNIIRNNVLRDAEYGVVGSFHEVRTLDNGGDFWFRAVNGDLNQIDCNARVSL